MSVPDSWAGLWQWIQSSPTQLASWVEIPSQNVDGQDGELEAFESGRDYFQVVVNEMYLTKQRKWLSAIDPMVFVATEFTYDGKQHAVPFVLGPSMLEKYKQPVPTGTIFSNTRVAGIHPYRGGRFSLTVVLYEVQRKNYAQDLLAVVERAAGALDFAVALSAYVKLADAVITGVNAMLTGGATNPVVGMHAEFGGLRVPLRPSHFALVDGQGVSGESLRVRDGRLLEAETDKPFRASDYVLFSVEQLPARDDETTLPFYGLWERVVADASKASEDAWKSAKGNMLVLMQEMLVSPDLTEEQALALTDSYMTKMKVYRERAKRTQELGQPDGDAADDRRRRTVGVLDLD